MSYHSIISYNSISYNKISSRHNIRITYAPRLKISNAAFSFQFTEFILPSHNPHTYHLSSHARIILSSTYIFLYFIS